jgi:hypothetical protein
MNGPWRHDERREEMKGAEEPALYGSRQRFDGLMLLGGGAGQAAAVAVLGRVNLSVSSRDPSTVALAKIGRISGVSARLPCAAMRLAQHRLAPLADRSINRTDAPYTADSRLVAEHLADEIHCPLSPRQQVRRGAMVRQGVDRRARGRAGEAADRLLGVLVSRRASASSDLGSD